MQEEEKVSEARRRTGLFVFLGSLLLVLLLLEGASRVLIPNRYFVWPPNFSTTFDAGENIPFGVTFPSKLTINAAGMRGELPSDSQQYRILAVGGSTTICVYLDDSQAWPYLLQSRTNEALGRDEVWVGNVGRPGHRTVQHIVQVDKLLVQHPDIDMVVLLLGINDLITDLSFSTQLRRAASEDPRQLLLMSFSFFPGWDDETPWYRRNLIGRLQRLTAWRPLPATGKLQPMDEKGEFVASLRRNRQNAGRIRHDLPNLSGSRAEYANHVGEIIDVAQRQGVRVLLLTQPTLWSPSLSVEERRLLWAGGPPLHRLKKGSAYYSVGALARAMRLYNDTLLEVCQKRGTECLDVAAQVEPNTENFYDDAHFTEHGSARIASLVSNYLLQSEPLGRTHRDP